MPDRVEAVKGGLFAVLAGSPPFDLGPLGQHWSFCQIPEKRRQGAIDLDHRRAECCIAPLKEKWEWIEVFRPERFALWTDNYSNLLGLLRWRWGPVHCARGGWEMQACVGHYKADGHPRIGLFGLFYGVDRLIA